MVGKSVWKLELPEFIDKMQFFNEIIMYFLEILV